MFSLVSPLLLCLALTLVVSEDCHIVYEEYTPEEGVTVYLPQPRDFMVDAPNWADCEGAEACEEGMEQSPIDVVTDELMDSPDMGPLSFHWRGVEDVVVTWTGDNQKFSVNWEEQGMRNYISHSELEGKYYMLQFHLHTPSEHTVDGELADVEVHFVHQSEAGAIAVVGVMFEMGDEDDSSEFLESMIGLFPTAESGTESYAFLIEHLSPSIVLGELGSHDYIHYHGSFTTPPCTEGVDWFLMSDSIKISPAQLEALKVYQGVNNRPIQQTHDRVVYSYNSHKGGLCSTVGSDCGECKDGCKKTCKNVCKKYEDDADCTSDCKDICKSKMCKEVC